MTAIVITTEAQSRSGTDCESSVHHPVSECRSLGRCAGTRRQTADVSASSLGAGLDSPEERGTLVRMGWLTKLLACMANFSLHREEADSSNGLTFLHPEKPNLV